MLSAIPGTSFYSCIFRAFGDWHPLRLPQDGAGRTWGISNETITWITGKGRQKQPQANSWISTHLVSSIWPMFIFCWLQMVTVYFLSSNTSVPTWSADFKSSQRHQPESKEEERNCASDNRHLCTKASNGSPLLSKWYEEQSSWVVGTSWYMNKITNKYYIYIFGERERERLKLLVKLPRKVDVSFNISKLMSILNSAALCVWLEPWTLCGLCSILLTCWPSDSFFFATDSAQNATSALYCNVCKTSLY